MIDIINELDRYGVEDNTQRFQREDYGDEAWYYLDWELGALYEIKPYSHANLIEGATCTAIIIAQWVPPQTLWVNQFRRDLGSEFNSTLKCLDMDLPVEWVCCQSNERWAPGAPSPPFANGPTQGPGMLWCPGQPRKRWGNRPSQDMERSNKCASRMRTLHTRPVPLFWYLLIIKLNW